jgi:hypothetical protein
MLRRIAFAAHIVIFGAVDWRNRFLNDWRAALSRRFRRQGE